LLKNQTKEGIILSKIYTQEELKLLTHQLFNDILTFKNYGKINKVYIDGISEFGDHRNTNYHRLGADLKSNDTNFEWNEDHRYCENQYDAHGVIDNCPKFDEWEEFAKRKAKELEKKENLGVDLTLEGIKYVLSLDVTVYQK
jgi:hypothetical protein